MVALSPACDVVREAKGDSCSALGIVASVGGCGDDNFKAVGEEKGSSFAIELDLRCCPGVIASRFTVNSYSVFVPPENLSGPT